MSAFVTTAPSAFFETSDERVERFVRFRPDSIYVLGGTMVCARLLTQTTHMLTEIDVGHAVHEREVQPSSES